MRDQEPPLKKTTQLSSLYESFDFIYATNKNKLLIWPHNFCVILQHQTSNCFNIKT